MTKLPRRARGERSQRQLRVGEVVRHALSRILERGGIRDPDLEGVSLTVTEVRVSPDIRNATVFVVPRGGAGAATVLAALRRAAPFLRARLGEEVTLRYLPALRFERDESFEAAGRIDSLLRAPDVARDLAADDEER